MPSLSFDYSSSPKRITVDLPDTSITVQQFVNLIRTEEARLVSLFKDDGHPILTASGKKTITAGGISAIIMDLTERGWLFGFAARPGPTYVQCTVLGGTIVASEFATFGTAFVTLLILSPVDGVGGVVAAGDVSKIDDIHAFQVRDLTSVTVNDKQTFTADGGRTMVVDEGDGTRVTTGAEPA